MPPRTIIYTGAPLSASLSFSEAHLTAPLQSAFLPSPPSTSSAEGRTIILDPSASAHGPHWRHLPLERQHLPTGLTQATNPDFRYDPLEPEGLETSFLSTTDLSHISNSDDESATASHSAGASTDNGEGKEEVLTQFYEHSFAIHNEIPSSRVLPADSFLSPTTNPSTQLSASSSSSLADEDSTDYSFDGTLNPPHKTARMNLLAVSVMDVCQIPTEAYLRSIEPQTMSVNLLVGIIAVPAPRTVVTRRAGREVQLIELVVGDETRAGFGINIWLSTSRAATGMVDAGLREQMEGLRTRDVVVMRNR
ncbi:MAG: hypothetical protein L6R40_003679 [Gallowayella cf. fulva]|nr:MAG: hypothetical protein L6R40_003679 [Xanthomendoza cf. fulva]